MPHLSRSVYLKHLTEIVLALLILLVQICFVPGLDVSEVGRFLIVGTGCLGLAACFTVYRFSVLDAIIAVPFLLITMVAPGYRNLARVD